MTHDVCHMEFAADISELPELMSSSFQVGSHRDSRHMIPDQIGKVEGNCFTDGYLSSLDRNMIWTPVRCTKHNTKRARKPAEP